MSWAETKKAVNNSVGTRYFKPLDEILGATLVLRGIAGTTFTVQNTEKLYDDFSITLSEKDDVYEGLEVMRIVPVHLGEYKVVVSYGDNSCSTEIIADQLGKNYTVEYMFDLAELTSSGTFIVPENLSKIYITACGGGGGGGGAASGGGAGGGGGADYIFMKGFSVTPGDTLDITIASGGSAGKGSVSGSTSTYCTDGGTGGTTVIGDLVSLVGGDGGGAVESATVTVSGNTYTRKRGAAGVGKRNNDGGIGGLGTNSTDSTPGKGGDGGAAASKTSPANPGSAGGNATSASNGDAYDSCGGGGGGGGCLGEGGAGAPGLEEAVTTSPASEGGHGAGGGGGGGRKGSTYGTDGAKGGGGVVYIYMGVKIE